MYAATPEHGMTYGRAYYRVDSSTNRAAGTRVGHHATLSWEGHHPYPTTAATGALARDRRGRHRSVRCTALGEKRPATGHA